MTKRDRIGGVGCYCVLCYVIVLLCYCFVFCITKILGVLKVQSSMNIITGRYMAGRYMPIEAPRPKQDELNHLFNQNISLIC